MSVPWKWAPVALLFASLALAQKGVGMVCNLSSPAVAIPPSATDVQVGDLLVTCQGGSANTVTGSPVPTLNWTLTMPLPVTSPIISTSGGNVSDALLFIDDTASVQPGTTVPPGFGSNAPPTLCAYNATATKGCTAYPNVAGGIPVMTSAPDPLGLPNPAPPAANIYQGVVSGNTITFLGVPILPPSTTGTRTYRFTNVRVNAAAGSSSFVVASLFVQGSGAPQMSFAQTMATLAAAQTGNAVFSAGDNVPNPVNVAPGQITNLFVQGVGSNLAFGASAKSFPLPAVLGGISVALTQTLGPSGPTRLFPVPLLAVRPYLPAPRALLLPPSLSRFRLKFQLPLRIAPVSWSRRTVSREARSPSLPSPTKSTARAYVMCR